MIPELDQFYLPKGKDMGGNQSRRYVIHYQVYSRANDQMKPGAATAASTFGTIGNDLKKLDTDMDTRIVNDVQALRSGYPGDKEPIANACTTALAVAEIAAREKRFQLLNLTLTAAPQTSTQVAQAIAKGAANFDPVTYRKVPLTTFDKDGAFSAEFHSDAAKEYISGWKAIGAQLADAKTKPRAGVLNVSELSAAFEPTNKPIADYLKGYIGYWTDDLRDKLKVAEFTSWVNIFTNDLKSGQWEVKALANIQDAVQEYLAAIEDRVQDEQVREIEIAA